MANKNFSIEEAESILPVLSKQLISARDIKNEIELYENDSFNTEQYLKTKMLNENKCTLREELYQFIKSIEQTGSILQDFDQGIIHFPINFQGKKAVLCWHIKDGERIKHWHYSKEACDERTKIIDVDEI